jgi:membrane protein YdbS with pleckstrin-like domain
MKTRAEHMTFVLWVLLILILSPAILLGSLFVVAIAGSIIASIVAAFIVIPFWAAEKIDDWRRARFRARLQERLKR